MQHDMTFIIDWRDHSLGIEQLIEAIQRTFCAVQPFKPAI